ncbi:MAG: cysteine--tRNA ligase [Thermodesulfobacteriota bacterium]
MGLRIYNTLSRDKQDFSPAVPGRVRMYVCGPTVYDASHMGHARSAVVFDVVYRYLRAKGFDVTYVRNFTDIDDKIINRANALGISCEELSGRYIREFHEDMDALFVLRPNEEPKATEFVGPIVAMVEKLVQKGVAYAVDGDVYFSVEVFPGYGKLSGRSLSDMDAGARVEVDDRKKSPFDFALWKSAKPGEPSWESPWGPGRPGWHIECSAMSLTHLGETFDIHGGGQDLIFPHHENEIAQSEAVNGVPFVRFWMHNGFVNVNSEKMSKSLGNFFTIRQVLEKFHPEAVRLFLLSKHYRSPVDFSDAAMDEARAALDRLYTCRGRLETLFADQAPQAGNTEHLAKFMEAMDDDFNTAGALGALFEAVRQANRLLDEQAAGSATPELAGLFADTTKMGGILGLFNGKADDYFTAMKGLAAGSTGVDPARVEALIAERSKARKEKNFARADAIRKELSDMGVTIQDSPSGTTWKLG